MYIRECQDKPRRNLFEMLHTKCYASFQAACVSTLIQPQRIRETLEFNRIRVSFAITHITRRNLFVPLCYSEIRCFHFQLSIPWNYIVRRLKARYRWKLITLISREVHVRFAKSQMIHFTGSEIIIGYKIVNV